MVSEEAEVERHGPLDAAQPFLGSAGTPVEGATVLDYWRWGHSNFLNNTSRGRLAEFLVARALGAPGEVANEWAPYDLVTPTGVRVEVKSAAYVQDWAPPKNAPRITFRIRPTRAWQHETATYADERRRQADVYVFALLAQQDRSLVDPIDVSQWHFFAIGTAVLDREFGVRKTISLKDVERLAPRASIEGLERAVSIAAVVEPSP
ncbi:MAG: hypothetical protein AB7G21_05600 [Dehalococcoidia bacterium]